MGLLDRTPARIGGARARRALARLAAPLRTAPAVLERGRIERALAQPGRRLRWLAISDRSLTVYGIGAQLWRRGLVPVGGIALSLPDGRPTFVEAAVREAAATLGTTLAIRGMTAVESGKILVELGDPEARGWFLRIAGGSSARYIDISLGAIRGMLEADPPPPVRRRLIAPVADGSVGVARYSLEPKAPGRHPRAMTPALWDECLEFLVALNRLDPGAVGPRAPGAFVDRLEPDRKLLSGLIDEGSGEALGALVRSVRSAVAALPFGWEHGDFWLRNLLTIDGRLGAVIDWDTSCAPAPPLLDLYDLVSLSARRAPRLAHVGPRLTDVLLPIAKGRGDERIRAYCAATGIETDSETLEAVAAAYWVSRAARAVRELPVRGELPWWVEENVARPLRELAPR